MKLAIFLSVVVSILLGILVCVIIDYSCQTSFQSLIAAIGFMIIVLLMGIESKIDKLLNKNKVMKHYILNCICAGIITLLFAISFKFTPYQTLILYFVMLTSFEIREHIDNNKKQ